MKRRELPGLSTTTRQIVVVAVFTSLYTVLRYIPTFPMYGIPGSSFRAADFLAPLYGVLLGPWLAMPCVVIGTVINYAFYPPLFLGLDFIPAVVGAVSAGFFSRRRASMAIAIYTSAFVIFVLLPLSTEFISVGNGFTVPYAWLHVIGLIAMLSPWGLRSSNWIEKKSGPLLVTAMVITTLSATLAQHLAGGILTVLIRFPVIGISTASAASVYWKAIFFLYPVERLIIVAVAATLGASVIRVLRAAGYQETLRALASPRLSKSQDQS